MEQSSSEVAPLSAGMKRPRDIAEFYQESATTQRCATLLRPASAEEAAAAAAASLYPAVQGAQAVDSPNSMQPGQSLHPGLLPNAMMGTVLPGLVPPPLALSALVGVGTNGLPVANNVPAVANGAGLPAVPAMSLAAAAAAANTVTMPLQDAGMGTMQPTMPSGRPPTVPVSVPMPSPSQIPTIPVAAAPFLPGQSTPALPSVSLPEPNEVVGANSTTTSITVKWEMPTLPPALLPHSHTLFWALEVAESAESARLETKLLPLSICESTINNLRPNVAYLFQVRLEHRQTPVASSCSAWAILSASTKALMGAPVTPPRPVVHRISSTLAEVTVLAAPCLFDDGYFCAEKYLLERFEGELPVDEGSHEGWEEPQAVAVTCTHPKAPEIVAEIEKLRFVLAGGSAYSFRVQAINAQGVSKWSDIATILPPPSAPEVRVEGTKSMSATLTWAPPAHCGFEIQHYHVFMSKVGAENADDGTLEAVVAAGTAGQQEGEGAGETSAAVWYHAQQLQPNCRYSVYVRARSEGGLSDPSNTCEIVTQPLPPPLPNNVTVDEIQTHSLRISWSLEEEGEMNRADVCQVYWREIKEEESSTDAGGKPVWSTCQDENEDWNTTQVSCEGCDIGADYCCLITELAADTLYAIQVRASNGGGVGPCCPAVNQRTRLLPPLPPAALDFHDTTPTSTTLSWEDASDDAHPVTSYQIKYQRVGDEEEGTWLTVSASEGEATRLCKVVEDLEPGQCYSFQLRGLNQHGPGPPSQPAEVTTLSDVPPPPSQPVLVQESPFSLLVAWSAPERDNGSEVLEYCLQMRSRSFSEWRRAAGPVRETQLMVSGCEPATIYDFRVRARNAEGWSEWSDESMMETLPRPAPDPPQWRIWHVTHNSATLCWMHHQLSIKSYEVQRLRGEQWVTLMEAEPAIAEQLRRCQAELQQQLAQREESQRDAPVAASRAPVISYTKQCLQSNSEHVFRVAAKNDGGVSFSAPLRVYTEEVGWGKALTDGELSKLRELCTVCDDATGCFEKLSGSLFDSDSLAALPRAELAELLERLGVRPRDRQRLRRALAPLPPPPTKPMRSHGTCSSISCKWEAGVMGDGEDGEAVVAYVVQWQPRGSGEKWEQAQCGTCQATITDLEASTEYAVRVAACNEPRGQGPWSAEGVFTTLAAECADEQLVGWTRGALRDQEYANRVAAQLYYEEWTLDSLKPLSEERLLDVLAKMKVKEGAIFSLVQHLRKSS